MTPLLADTSASATAAAEAQNVGTQTLNTPNLCQLCRMQIVSWRTHLQPAKRFCFHCIHPLLCRDRPLLCSILQDMAMDSFCA